MRLTTAFLLPTMMMMASAFQSSFPTTRSLVSRSTHKTTLSAFGELANAGSVIGNFYEFHPYLSAFLTCSVKASAADYIAQKKSQEDPEAHNNKVIDNDNDLDHPEGVDLPRNLAFLTYGGLYQGVAQQFLYSVLFPAWFGLGDATVFSIVKQVATDVAVVTPFVCFPIVYSIKSIFASSDHMPSLETLQSGLEKYIEDVSTRGLLFKYWSLWIPAQTLTFSLVPPHLRVVFVACVSFFWIMILSTVSSSTSEEDTAFTESKIENKIAVPFPPTKEDRYTVQNPAYVPVHASSYQHH